MKIRFLALAAVALLALACGVISGAARADGVGVILMHGKDGTGKPQSPVGKLASYLEAQGMTVVLPDMPWSRSRGLDKTLEDSFSEIDKMIEELRAKGMTKIILGGHSMGGCAALAYATQVVGLDGILVMAPGHRPVFRARENAAVLAKAKALVDAGKAGEMVDVVDRNQGDNFTRNVRADVAISWFSPDGLANMALSSPKVKSGTPVYVIIGNKDRYHSEASTEIFEKLPAHPKSAYKVIPGGHKVTPFKGKSEIADWIKNL